jgi:hypothetical protein
MNHIALTEPPQVNWPELFAMNAIVQGSGHGPAWCTFTRGMEVIYRHTQDEKIIGRGKVALLEWLGM